MSSRAIIWMLAVVALITQSCDTESNIEKPADFYKLIGNDGSQTAVDMVQSADGKLFILGTSTSKSNGIQNYLVRTNIRGEVEWESTFGTTGNDDPRDIELLRDGKLAIVSNIINDAGRKDFRIYIIDPNDGSTVATSQADPETTDNTANSLTELLDGGFVVAATLDAGTFRKGRVFKYSNTLVKVNVAWNTKIELLDANGADKGYDVVPVKVFQISDELYYTFCYSNAPAPDDNREYNYVIIASGEDNFTAAGYNYSYFIKTANPNSNETLTSVVPVTAGSPGPSYLLTGYTTNPATNRQELFVVRTKATLFGTSPSDQTTYVQATRTLPTTSLTPSTTLKAIGGASRTGLFVLANEVAEGNDIYLTKISGEPSMDDLWSPRTYVSFGGINDDTAAAIMETSDGRIIVCGTMGLGDLGGQTKIVLMNLNPNGMFGE